MKILKFKDFEEFACDIADKFDSIKKIDEYNDIAIIAKYEEARQIIKELLCIGYYLRSIDIHDPSFDGYEAEFLISVSNAECENEVYCEPMLRENGYLTDESTIIYVLDNCSSKVVSHCDSEIIYEVAVGEEDCGECCECGGSKCACKEDTDDKVEYDVKSDDDGYSITVRCNLNVDEAMKTIKDMENRMERMNDMFREMDYFRRLFRW